MIGLVVSVFIANKPAEIFKNFVNNKSLLLLSLGFIWLFISYPVSENVPYYFNRLQIKLPLLILPLAFAGVKLDRKTYLSLSVFYILLTFFVSIFTFANYLVNYASINASYLESKVMPTIINHVRFSIMLAMGCYLSYYLFKTEFLIRYSFEKWIYVSISILLFIFIHIYSVRSGLIAIYGIILAELLTYIFRSRSYIRPVLFVASISVVFIICINYTPTLQNKWINTKADITTYLTHGYPNYSSLTTRFISYDAAIDIFKHNILMGCGLGDIKDETDLYFKTHYPEIDIPILPHNQFLFYLAATGCIGLILFLVTFFFPIFYKKNGYNEVLLMQYVILFLSFQTEPMLETQLGIAYSMIFILLPLTQKVEDENVSAQLR